MKIKKIGIECGSIEDEKHLWGVGKMIIGLLQEISHRPELELEKNFRFVLYFKDIIPDFSFLNSPIFEKKLIPVPFFKGRLFPIYYFALLPVKLWFERLDWMFWPNYMLPIIAPGKSIVMLTEDVYYETHEGKLPFRYRLAYGIFASWTAKFATKILAISETSKKNIAKLYKINSDRIFVNYPGVDVPSNSQPKVDNKNPYILYVGQMFPRRHAKETIIAYEKIASDFPDLKLIMVGPDKYPTPTIDLMISDINKKLSREAVVHKNYISNEELVQLYANAKALIYISDREAFGLPPMEALSYGVPPVIMDNELGHELFGDYAFYVANPDLEGITEAIRQSLTNSGKIKRINDVGSEFVKKYNWKNFTDKFLNVIQK